MHRTSTVCVKVAVTQYLGGSRNRQAAVPSRFAIEILSQAWRHLDIWKQALSQLTMAWTKISCVLWRPLYVWLVLVGVKEQEVIVQKKAWRAACCCHQQSRLCKPNFLFRSWCALIISTQHLMASREKMQGWNFREMFISYTQWFNDKFMVNCLSAVSIGRLWICWYRFY